jgi:hypothetical protein
VSTGAIGELVVFVGVGLAGEDSVVSSGDVGADVVGVAEVVGVVAVSTGLVAVSTGFVAVSSVVVAVVCSVVAGSLGTADVVAVVPNWSALLVTALAAVTMPTTAKAERRLAATKPATPTTSECDGARPISFFQLGGPWPGCRVRGANGMGQVGPGWVDRCNTDNRFSDRVVVRGHWTRRS